MARQNVTLWTKAFARRLLADSAGERISAVEVERHGETLRVEAPLFIVACGAVNSAALLLRSATSARPEGWRIRRAWWARATWRTWPR
jgi:choline dehydrogenase-like flavoprotein